MLLSKKLGIILALSGFLLLVGCADNPGKWPKEKLEEYVKEALAKEGLEVTEISLAMEDGKYKGSAKDAGGETLQLIVTQDIAARNLTWDAKGDRGSFFGGSFELK
jgi:major membrane immunogen (membrane-anchored lipoprotein)